MQTSATDVGLGLRQELSNSVSLAAVLFDLLEFNKRWTLGLGGVGTKNVRWEIDFAFQHETSSFRIRTLTSRAGIVLIAPNHFEFKAGFGFNIIPEISDDYHGLELGLNYWFSNKFALYGLYQNPDSQYIIGFKIAG